MLFGSNRSAIKLIVVVTRPSATFKFAQTQKTKVSFAINAFHMLTAFNMLNDEITRYTGSNYWHFVFVFNPIVDQIHVFFRAIS